MALGVDNLGSGLVLPLVLVHVTAVVGVPLGTAGLLLTAGTVVGLLAPPLAGGLVDRVGPKAVVVVSQALQAAASRGEPLTVRADVEAASDREVQERFAGTAWLACDSWYRQEDGRIVTNWPGYMRDYAAATRVLDPDDFALIGPTGTR